MSEKISEFKKTKKQRKTKIPPVDNASYQKPYSCLFNGITEIIETIDNIVPDLEKKDPDASSKLFAVSELLKELQQESEEIYIGG